MNDIEKNRYLSEEELEKLIAMTEAEPLLHPPGEFKSEILGRIRRKRKYTKNLRLFSYSVKVFAATAAALTIMLIAPENIRPEDVGYFSQEQTVQEGQEQEMSQIFNGNLMYQLNEKIDDYCSQLNNRLNQLVGMEDY
ncbi:MAG: hypothetical protein HDR30_02695 [Lachnospiraceae bacterium]|nr:hypothetical protein [Lachnospiraceae bacterium]